MRYVVFGLHKIPIALPFSVPSSVCPPMAQLMNVPDMGIAFLNFCHCFAVMGSSNLLLCSDLIT